MFAYNDLQLELLKTQKALDMLGSTLSQSEYERVCAGLIEHRDTIRGRLRAMGVEVEAGISFPTTESTSRSQKKRLEAWSKFVSKGEVDASVSTLIVSSWRRCWARVNPIQEINPVRLNPSHLLSTQVASFDLISVARPIMEDVYQCIEQSGVAIGLINSAGCILDGLGDSEILARMRDWGMTPGAIVTEDQMGTNSFGLALAERVPVQVIGAEHYLQKLHGIAGAAAPMFDMSGHLLGVVGLIMELDKYHFYSLGVVTACARAIESQRQSDILLAEQNNQLAQLNTILSTISDGILVFNNRHTVLHSNPASSKILEIPQKALLGKHVSAIFELPSFLKEAIDEHKPLTDVEVTLRIGARTVTCLMSLDYVLNKSDLQWVIMTLRTEKQVRNLVTQQVGASAPLTLDDIPGESPQIQRVRTFIKSAAKARASVLIRGETGTGKNALANAIHNVSQRREGPFVIFACSSIPTELALRELLGYDDVNDEKRVRSRPSKFELAHGGTLYFQDVDALPLEAQAVLLNALEVGFIQRQGSRRPIEIDVRVVASTTASIERLTAQGSFRPDLYYRLSTFTITLPPLRERPRDIPLVIDRILKRLAQQWGFSRLELDTGVIDVLRRYPWPGNVREIEAVLGRAVAQSGSTEKITLDMLPHTVRYTTHLANIEQDDSSIQPMNEIERQAILNTARLCQGNVTLMAQALDISRTTLWRRMRQYGIQPKEYRLTRGEPAISIKEGHEN